MGAFAGKVALVTGGTRGIGRACAAMLAENGARVAICGRTAETAQAAAAELASATGGEVRGYGCDIADAEAVNALIKAVEAELGIIAILVNNAGVTRDTLLMRMKDDDWDAVLNANLTGAFYCCRAAVRGMLKQRWGRIINISSIVGVRGQAGQANYAASKAGLIGFSKSLARELGSRGITVNVVAPGYIDTDMTAVLSDELKQAIVQQVPMGKVGNAQDIAAGVQYLASEGAAYVTGAVLQIDGGLAM